MSRETSHEEAKQAAAELLVDAALRGLNDGSIGRAFQQLHGVPTSSKLAVQGRSFVIFEEPDATQHRFAIDLVIVIHEIPMPAMDDV